MKKNLPTKVHFIDKVGTTIEIVLLKFRNNGYFTHEMQNILNHYHLKDNGWIKFNYIEFTQKKKSVQLYWWQEDKKLFILVSINSSYF